MPNTHPFTVVRFRRRGSILIFVVALLTLIALVGTALVATSRTDRAASQIHVQTVSLDATHQRFEDLLQQKVFHAIARGYGHDVDSARTDTWLGDRLPTQFPGALPPVDGKINLSQLPWPMWRFVSGIIDRYDNDLASTAAWEPPFQYTPSSPVSLLNLTTPANSVVKLGVEPANPTITDLGYAMVPHSLSITYPTDHPEEAMRGLTRTFPAAYFVSRTAPYSAAPYNDVTTGMPYLAGDADGDGIADSILFRLSSTPIDGVTYYGAIRVIDNNSAINVNTAGLRTSEVGPGSLIKTTGIDTTAFVNPATRGANNGFFTSDIGLFELLDPYNGYKKSDGATAEGGGRAARDNEWAELEEYLLGYPITGVDGNNDAGGWCDAFDDYSNPGTRNTGTYPDIRDMFASFNNTGLGAVAVQGQLVGIEDRAQDPGDATNTWNPDPDGSATNDSIGNYSPATTPPSASRIRPDFTFTTQNEAFATMAARRWESIRYGTDLRLIIDSSAAALSTPADRDAILPEAAPENVDKNVGDLLYLHRASTDTTRSQAEHAFFPYRWFDEQEAANLAYHFCLINPRGTQSSLDAILRHSAYRAAPNWKPTISDTNPSWDSFPANEYQYWFQFLNFDGTQNTSGFYLGTDSVVSPGVTYPTNMAFTQGLASSGLAESFTDIQANSALASSKANQPRFRSIRPLLTTYNPVNNSSISTSYLYANNKAFAHGAVNTPFAGIDWNRDGTADESTRVYPGMMLNDMVNLATAKYRIPENWSSATQYSLNDLVYLPGNRITYMCIRDTTASLGISPTAVANFDAVTGEPLYWEPQPWVSGKTKASVNTAGFSELWRAFFDVISSDAVSNSSIDYNLKSFVDSTTTSLSIAPPNLNNSDDYAFFPLTVSDPLIAAVPAPGITVTDPNVFYLRFYDPYRGMRFHITDTTGTTVDPATGLPTGIANDPTFDPSLANYPEVNNSLTPASWVYEKNSLGMFRSVIRDPRPIRPALTAPSDPANPDEYLTAATATAVDTASVTNAYTTIRGTGASSPQERLTPLQMATLRSAIAAFNAEDMLNFYGLRENTSNGAYSIDDVPAKTIILYDTTREYPNPNPNTGATANGTGIKEAIGNYPGPESPRPQYEVTIYGNRPQLFISEVFANNDAYPYTFDDMYDLPGGTSAKKQYQNPNGYVAIELYNPYPVSVNIKGWVITSIDRSTNGDFGQSAHKLGGSGALRIELDTLGLPPSIGPKQCIVIDSYSSTITPLTPSDPHAAPYASRQYRPPASGLLPLWETDANEALWHADPAATYPAIEGRSALDPSDNSKPAQAIFLASTSFLEHFTQTSSNDKELIVLRPRHAGASGAPLEQMVPVDQFDFTGMLPDDTTGATCQSIHYARNVNGWQVVYPGRYDGGRNPNPTAPPYVGPRRFQGTWVTPPIAVGGNRVYSPAGVGRIDPWISPAYTTAVGSGPFTVTDPTTQRYGDMSMGYANPRSTIDFSIAPVGAQQIVQNLSIPLLGYPSAFNPMITNSAVAQAKIQHPVAQTINQFPFGGFARNGDILQIPFIAAYRIRKYQSAADGVAPPRRSVGIAGVDGFHGVNPGQPDPAYGTNILEMNSISMDAAMAEDTDPTNDNDITTTVFGESVGRFNLGANSSAGSKGWTAYNWVTNLFRYLDVHVPASDYLPDANPAFYPAGSSITNAAANTHQLAKPINNRPNNPNLTIDPGASPTNEISLLSQTPTSEESAATQGLININTASAKVLSMLPIVPTTTGAIDVAKTQAAATDIYNYVTNTADFQSLFDLNKLPTFQPGGGAGTVTTAYSTDYSKIGDVYPVYADPAGTTQVDPASGSVKQQTLLMNRISNLITTKSDTFTVYLLVQGWREAGTQFPVLDWEQRQAYIVDRSTGTLRITKVPTD